MAKERLTIRLDEKIKTKAQKATVLLGRQSLTDYVIRLVEQDADQVIAQHETITLEDDVFDEFMAACEKVKAPNQALCDAVSFSEVQGFSQ